MTSEELRQVIKETFPFARINIADSSYAVPQIDWITGDFYNKLFLPWTETNNLNKWKETWDCDNFAYLFFVFSQICHAKSNRPEEGLAVGVMYYATDDGGGHAINFAVSKGEVKTIEPQTGKIVNLSQKEKTLCSFITC